MSSQDRFRNKNQSMNSTHHMSCNQSHTTGFYKDQRHGTPTTNYSHIPLVKDRPHWNQSASTWRHTSQNYSFSRQERFKDNPPYYSDIIQPQIPSTLSSRTCTLGYDKKKPISVVVLRNAKEKPAPDRYDLSVRDEAARHVSRGKSFGLGWKSYEKTFIDHRTDVFAQFQTENNPSAHYQVRQIPGKDANKFTIYGRLKMYSQKMADDKNWVPGPVHQIKDRELYGTVGMHDRNFAFGERIDLARPANNYPEAIYHIPGFCSRFINIRHKKQRIAPASH